MPPRRSSVALLSRRGYTEISKIGEGSFGQAILVRYDADGTKMVCKTVDLSHASSKESQDAAKEGRILSGLRHPYVVRYRESFLEEGWLCIVMDYCEGGDLATKIDQARKRREPFAEPQVLRWATQSLLALKYIHDKHVLHRDLKSSNLFLTKTDNVKVGDFGIAKVLACTQACARTQIGTPYYLSPEVCQEKPYTWPSDIWAIGIIVFELCALKVPFDAPNLNGLVQRICRGPTPQIPPSFCADLRQLNDKMLSRSPHQRPGAQEILQMPLMQGVVRSLLSEVQGQDGQDGIAAAARQPSAGPPADRAAAGPTSPRAAPGAMYQKGDKIEFYSLSHKEWLPATVTGVDGEGNIVIDLKPNSWLSREIQATKVRSRGGARGRAPSAQCPTPIRERSPRRWDGPPSSGGGPRSATPRGVPTPEPFWARGLPGLGAAPAPGSARHRSPSPRFAAPSPRPLPGTPQARPPIPRAPPSPYGAGNGAMVRAGMAILGPPR